MKKRNFFRIITNSELTQKEAGEFLRRRSYSARIVMRDMRLYLKTPLEMEKTKFMPEIYQNKRTYTIAFIVTSLVATYLYAWRKNYIEEQWVRERGAVIHQENRPHLLITRYLLMNFAKYLLSSYVLNHQWQKIEVDNLNSESFNISPQKEIAFKTAVISQYLKKRNNKYDFLYLGETEELNIL